MKYQTWLLPPFHSEPESKVVICCNGGGGLSTVKPGLSGHSKIDKTKVLKTCGYLMWVKSTTESAILLTCIKRLLVLKTCFYLFCVAA